MSLVICGFHKHAQRIDAFLSQRVVPNWVVAIALAVVAGITLMNGNFMISFACFVGSAVLGGIARYGEGENFLQAPYYLLMLFLVGGSLFTFMGSPDLVTLKIIVGVCVIIDAILLSCGFGWRIQIGSDKKSDNTPPALPVAIGEEGEEEEEKSLV